MADDLTVKKIQEAFAAALKEDRAQAASKEGAAARGGVAARDFGADLPEQAAQLDKMAKAYKSMGGYLEHNIELQQTQRNLAQVNLEIAEKKLREQLKEDPLDKLKIENLQKAVKLAEDTLALQKRAVKEAEKWNISLEKTLDIAEELGKSLGGTLRSLTGAKGYTATFVKIGKAIMGASHATGGWKAAALEFGKAALASIALAMIDSMITLAVKTRDTEAAFRRATGASAEMAGAMTEGWEETRRFGVQLEAMQGSMTALRSTFTDFTMLPAEQAKELAKTGAVLEKLGVQHADFAKGIQNSTKMLGMSTEAAEDTQLELRALAVDIGVAPQKMAADFANAGNKLAKFGDQGTKAFKDIALISKITGMEVEKILGLVEKFDTFEGAAEQAGKLNAALGGNFVNAMDLMMTTDPAERFEMIRGSILDAGLSFDEMSYYQKQFYTESLGLSDVGDLALMLSGDMSVLEGQIGKTSAEYEKSAEEAKKLQSMQDLLKSTMAAMIPVLTPIVEGLASFVGWLTSGTAGVAAFQGVLIAITTVMTVYSIVSAIAAISTMALTLPAWGLWAAGIALVAMFSYLIKTIFFDDVGASNFPEGLMHIGESFSFIGEAADFVTGIFEKLAPVIEVLGGALKFALKYLNPLGLAFTVATEGVKGVKNAFSSAYDSVKGFFSDDVGASNILEGTEKLSGGLKVVGVATNVMKAYFEDMRLTIVVFGEAIAAAVEPLATMFSSIVKLVEIGGLGNLAAEFVALAGAIDMVPANKAVTLTGTIAAATTAAAAPAAPAPAAAAGGGGGGGPIQVTLQLDGAATKSLLAGNVIKVMGEWARDAVYGTA